MSPELSTRTAAWPPGPGAPAVEPLPGQALGPGGEMPDPDEVVDGPADLRGELARLVEERTVALIAAHEEIEQAHRRRQDMHERMRILSSRLGSTDLEGADLRLDARRDRLAVGQVLDVDVVAIYTADEHGAFEDSPVVWHPDR